MPFWQRKYVAFELTEEQRAQIEQLAAEGKIRPLRRYELLWWKHVIREAWLGTWENFWSIIGGRNAVFQLQCERRLLVHRIKMFWRGHNAS